MRLTAARRLTRCSISLSERGIFDPPAFAFKVWSEGFVERFEQDLTCRQPRPVRFGFPLRDCHDFGRNTELVSRLIVWHNISSHFLDV
jgi:hypothetical protein